MADANVKVSLSEERFRKAVQEFVDAMAEVLSCYTQALEKSGLVESVEKLAAQGGFMVFGNREPQDDGPSLPTVRVDWAKAVNHQLTAVLPSGAIFEVNMAKNVDGQIYIRDDRSPGMDWHPIENGWVTVLD